MVKTERDDANYASVIGKMSLKCRENVGKCRFSVGKM